MTIELHTVRAGSLDVGYWRLGEPSSPTIILLHGFPYDVHSYEQIAPDLAAQGFDVVVPYLRGYGPTRFVDANTPRSGEQAVLANDLLALLDALQISHATLAGYDWGGRAACIVAALWPTRVTGLLTCGGYNVQHIASAGKPAAPHDEYKYWYQYYFHSERGRLGLTRNTDALCRLLWQLWSPDWSFSDAQFARSAAAFSNPDFVDVVVHSYRHRYGLVAGDPAVAGIGAALDARPVISVPVISIDGGSDGVMPSGGAGGHASQFTGPYEHIVLPGIGHNVPQEAPAPFAAAVQKLATRSD